MNNTKLLTTTIPMNIFIRSSFAYNFYSLFNAYKAEPKQATFYSQKQPLKLKKRLSDLCINQKTHFS